VNTAEAFVVGGLDGDGLGVLDVRLQGRESPVLLPILVLPLYLWQQIPGGPEAGPAYHGFAHPVRAVADRHGVRRGRRGYSSSGGEDVRRQRPETATPGREPSPFIATPSDYQKLAGPRAPRTHGRPRRRPNPFIPNG
jgi:hypothetical protein